MRTAVLILAHKNPAQLERLCGALRHPDAAVYVHLDAKADISLYGGAGNAGAEFIRRRADVRWGGFSMVGATLASLRQIASCGVPFDYLHLISGQDYPVRPTEEIIRELSAHPGRNYMACRPLDESDPADRALTRRYRLYHTESGNRAVHVALKVLNRILFINRKPPLHPVYKGSQWFTLTRESIRYILDYCDEHPEYVRFFRRTACPDEMFFHTILAHSPLAGTMTGDNRRYIRWSGTNPNPDTLTAADFAAITGSGAWFARKFDDGDPVLDMLDGLNK